MIGILVAEHVSASDTNYRERTHVSFVNSTTIVLIDRDDRFRSMFSSLFATQAGFRIVSTSELSNAFRTIQQEDHVDLVLLDFICDTQELQQFCADLRAFAPHIPVLLMVPPEIQQGDPTFVPPHLKAIAEKEFLSYTPKKVDQLFKRVRDSFRRKDESTLSETTRKALASAGIVFESDAMKKVILQAVESASSGMNVIITGETGVGKSALARAIHLLSKRKDYPLIEFPCSLHSGNIDGYSKQLFGFAQAMSGQADTDCSGLIEEAEGGTLFLEEVSDIPSVIQTALLHSLDTKRFRRVGETAERLCDLRIISSSTIELDDALRQSKLRQDFLRRIKQDHIHIPALASRREDIPVIVQHVVDEYSSLNKKSIEIEPSAIAFLQRQPWQGNAGQLRTVVLRTLMTMTESMARVSDFVPQLQRESNGYSAGYARQDTSTRAQSNFQSTSVFPTAAPLNLEDKRIGALSRLQDVVRIEDKAPLSNVEEVAQKFVRELAQRDDAPNFDEVMRLIQKSLIEESLKRTGGRIAEAERRFWRYSDTGKGGLSYQIKKFSINLKEFRSY